MTIFDETKKGMEAALEHFTQELRNLRTNRANPSLVEGIMCEVYGAAMRIKDLATITAPEARQLLITPFDGSTANSIAKGIEKANIGLQAQVDGNIIRVPIPPLNEEIRRDIVKEAKKKTETAKVAIREHRRKGNDMAKKQKSDGDLAEDGLKKLEKDIQQLTDKFCKEADEIMSAKEKDIMSV